MLTGTLTPTMGDVFIQGLSMEDHELEIKGNWVILDEPKIYEGLRE